MVVRIVVDSTSDIGVERAERAGIIVVPVTISFGEEEYRDGIDIDNQRFYTKIKKSAVLPKTAAPSVGSFAGAYLLAIKEGATAILSIHVSSAISGTLNAASLAAEMVHEDTNIPIKVLDSLNVSAGFGLPSLLAAELARKGASLEAVSTFVRDVLGRLKAYFILDTLEYLQRGGRIGMARFTSGTALNLKPILSFKQGVVVSVGQARSNAKALMRLTELLKNLSPIENVALAVSDLELIEKFKEAILPVYSGHIEEFTFGAALGTYVGPYAGGVFAICRGKDGIYVPS